MTTRTDLTFIRRRGRPEPAPAGGGDLALGSGLDLDSPGPDVGRAEGGVAAFMRRRTRRPDPAPAPPEPSASSHTGTLDLDTPAPAPAAGNPLDLGASAPPSTPAQPPGGNPLDLGTSEAPDTATPGSGAGGTGTGDPLDLSTPAAPAPSGADPLDLTSPSGPADGPVTSPSGRHRRLPRHQLDLPTVAAGERRRMDDDDVVVHLTRAQSAFGALEITPAVPAGAAMALGVAYEARGTQGVVLSPIAPMGPDPMSPIFRTSGGGVIVNLRHVAALDRFLIYAVLTGQNKTMPGGTVVVGTYGGSRMELPLGTQPTYGAQALLTAYVVEGRIVLRAEHDPFSGTLHQVCDAYGYSELTWRDPFTPLT